MTPGDFLADLAPVLAVFEGVTPGGIVEHCNPRIVLERAFVLGSEDLDRLRKLPGVRFLDGFEVDASDGQPARFAVTTIGVGRSARPKFPYG